MNVKGIRNKRINPRRLSQFVNIFGSVDIYPGVGRKVGDDWILREKKLIPNIICAKNLNPIYNKKLINNLVEIL